MNVRGKRKRNLWGKKICHGQVSAVQHLQGFGEKLINVMGGKPEMEKRKLLKIPQNSPLNFRITQAAVSG